MVCRVEFDVLIPARYGASRLPGKPLLEAGGRPLIQWTHDSARSSSARRVIVATDDRRILEAVAAFGGEVHMTSRNHRSGSDRIAEVAEQLGLAPERIVVNVQGDEPLMPAATIDQVARALAEDAALSVSTACHAIQTDEELNNPNVVKVVRDAVGRALYFSRAPIPWRRVDARGSKGFRHIGIYAYRAGFLREFTSWPSGVLEEVEQLEQLRILERGVPIGVCEAEAQPGPGVDTIGDLARFREIVQRMEA